MNTQRIAIYVRVSTEKQTHDSQPLDLREYCEKRGWAKVTEYSDTISGSKFSRKGLDSLMKEIRRSKVDAVVCYKLDRLGRSLAHLAQIVAELTSHSVALVVPSQGIDTSGQNPASQLQLNILMAIAEFDRAIMQERGNAGLRAAKARGKRLGRPGTLQRHQKAVNELVRQGKGVREIARELGLAVGSAAKLVKGLQAS